MFDKEAVNYIAMNILSCHGKNTETGFHRFKCSGEGIEAEMNK
jgi:hypothetical protein